MKRQSVRAPVTARPREQSLAPPATGHVRGAAIGAVAGAAAGALTGAAPYAGRIYDLRGVPPGGLTRDVDAGGLFRKP